MLRSKNKRLRREKNELKQMKDQEALQLKGESEHLGTEKRWLEEKIHQSEEELGPVRRRL